MLLHTLMLAATAAPVLAVCEVSPWSDWSACEPKSVFMGCDFAAGPPGWRAPPEGAKKTSRTAAPATAPDNAAYVAEMMEAMKRQGEAAARASAEQDAAPANAERLGPAACAGGDAGGFGCSNVDLESWTPIAELGALEASYYGKNTNDNWGWTANDGREWALQCTNYGVAFLDLGCPACDPPLAAAEAVEDFVMTGGTDSGGSIWRDVKVYDHYAIIVSETRKHGLQVFDLERLDPSHARHDKDGDGFYEPDALFADVGGAHNVVVNEETARAYAVGVWSPQGYGYLCNGGMFGVDLRDPADPKSLGCVFTDAYVHDAQCVVYRGPDAEHFGREICFLFTGDDVRVVDVTDASDGGGDVTLSKLNYEGVRYAHQGWLTCDHTSVFVDDELDEGGAVGTKTYVLDVADLDAPRVRFVHEADIGVIDHNQYVNGAFLYQANYAGGLRVLDISDAELDGDAAKATGRPGLKEVAFFDVLPDRDTASFLGSWNVHPFFASGRVVVNDVQAGTAIVKPTGLAVETRTRNVTARDAGDVCPNLFQERSCDATSSSSTTTSSSADACAGLKKGKCKKAATCEYKKRTCRARADACAGLSKKRCKETSGCRFKRTPGIYGKQCQTFDCAALKKKKCKKDDSTCKWRKKTKKCKAR